jgi:hypothetical protein
LRLRKVAQGVLYVSVMLVSGPFLVLMFGYAGYFGIRDNDCSAE